jgi:hypothetical protein
MIFAAERWRQPRQKSRNGLFATACDAGDPAPALVSIIAERTMLSGDGQYGLQRLRRPADQELDVIEAHLERPRAEPVLPGPLPSSPGRAENVVLYSFSPPIRPVQQSTKSATRAKVGQENLVTFDN